MRVNSGRTERASWKRLAGLTLALAAGLAGCSTGSGGSTDDQGGEHSGLYVDVAEEDATPEGLTEEEADQVGSASETIPADLSGLTYMGSPLFDGGALFSRTRDASASECIPPVVAVREAIRSMMAQASEYGNRGPIPKDDAGPAQTKLAYVWDGKNPDSRKAAGPNCQDKLFGLDCSGFTRLSVAAGDINVPNGTGPQSNPASYAFPQSFNGEVKMIKISKPKRYFTGDIILFPGHNGIIAEQNGSVYVWHSQGDPDATCEYTQKSRNGNPRGPSSISLAKLQSFGGKFATPNGVLRMVPKCIDNNAEDTLEALERDSQELVEQFIVIVQEHETRIMACQSEACAIAVWTSYADEWCELNHEWACLLFRGALLDENFADGQVNQLLQQLQINLTVDIPYHGPCSCRR